MPIATMMAVEVRAATSLTVVAVETATVVVDAANIAADKVVIHSLVAVIPFLGLTAACP